MVTLLEPWTNGQKQYAGLSTDTKPIEGVENGDKFIEIDTGKIYLFDAQNAEWTEQPASGGGSDLPEVSISDDGKVLGVKNGSWDTITAGLPVVQLQQIAYTVCIQFDDDESDLVKKRQPFVLYRMSSGGYVAQVALCMSITPTPVLDSSSWPVLFITCPNMRDDNCGMPLDLMLSKVQHANNRYMFKSYQWSSEAATYGYFYTISPFDANSSWNIPSFTPEGSQPVDSLIAWDTIQGRPAWKPISEALANSDYLTSIWLDVVFDDTTSAMLDQLLQYATYAALQASAPYTVLYTWDASQASDMTALLWDMATNRRRTRIVTTDGRGLIPVGMKIIDDENYLAELSFSWEESSGGNAATTMKYNMVLTPQNASVTCEIRNANPIQV